MSEVALEADIRGHDKCDANDPELTSSSPHPKHHFVTPERIVVPAKGAFAPAG
jgi:hypothetical protein